MYSFRSCSSYHGNVSARVVLYLLSMLVLLMMIMIVMVITYFAFICCCTVGIRNFTKIGVFRGNAFLLYLILLILIKLRQRPCFCSLFPCVMHDLYY
jgi:hypothetical protein